jgi:hypothetical protein
LKKLQTLDGQHARLNMVMDVSQHAIRDMLVHEVIPLVETLFVASRGVKDLEGECKALQLLLDGWKERCTALDAKARVVGNELRACAKQEEMGEDRVVESRRVVEEKRRDVEEMTRALEEEARAIVMGVKELEALSCGIEKQSAQKSTLAAVSKMLDDMTVDWLDQVESLEKDHRGPLERECDQLLRECNEIGCILHEVSNADTPVIQEKARKALPLPYDIISRIRSVAQDGIAKLEREIVDAQSQMALARREMKDVSSQQAKVITRHVQFVDCCQINLSMTMLHAIYYFLLLLFAALKKQGSVECA